MKSKKDKEINKISNNVPKENILDSLENNVTSRLNSLEKNISNRLDGFNKNLDKLNVQLDRNDKSLDKSMKWARFDLFLVSFLAGLVIAYILLAP